MKLRSSIILTQSNNYIYAMDVDDSSSKIFKFEAVAAHFIKELSNKKNPDQIIQSCLEVFEDCNEAQVKEDFKNFVTVIEGHGLIQKSKN